MGDVGAVTGSRLDEALADEPGVHRGDRRTGHPELGGEVAARREPVAGRQARSRDGQADLFEQGCRGLTRASRIDEEIDVHWSDKIRLDCHFCHAIVRANIDA
jgi:hypothetical protein